MFLAVGSAAEAPQITAPSRFRVFGGSPKTKKIQLQLEDGKASKTDHILIRGSAEKARAVFTMTTLEGDTITVHTAMTEANFSGKGLAIAESKELAAFLPACT
jgi:hypothetical protein